MTQDNIQQDTPQENTNSSNEQQYASLEEAVFGGEEGSNSNVTGAFTSGNKGNTETAPQGQPAVGNEGTNQPPVQTNNDETRYQYWQSQADKYKNELDSVKAQQRQPVQQQQQPVAPVETKIEEFPSAPNRPQQPRGFNREEAYNDSSSESARYMDELEGWRDDMSQYNTLKSEYNTAVIEDKFNKMQEEKIIEAKRQRAAQLQANQQAEVKNHVMGHYGMQENEAKDFINSMSDPNSINIDNLVQLYRMKNSGGGAQQTPVPPTPSETFTQTQNAQQVPSPMGVMPSGNSNVDGRSVEDKMMDTMIGNFDSKNPWK